MRLVIEIQREGYGEVDFNFLILVLENFKINISIEGEDNKESIDQVLEIKNLNNEKKGIFVLLINSIVIEGSKSCGILLIVELENEEGVDIIDVIDNFLKFVIKNFDIEFIKLLF